MPAPDALLHGRAERPGQPEAEHGQGHEERLRRDQDEQEARRPERSIDGEVAWACAARCGRRAGPAGWSGRGWPRTPRGPSSRGPAGAPWRAGASPRRRARRPARRLRRGPAAGCAAGCWAARTGHGRSHCCPAVGWDASSRTPPSRFDDSACEVSWMGRPRCVPDAAARWCGPGSPGPRPPRRGGSAIPNVPAGRSSGRPPP